VTRQKTRRKRANAHQTLPQTRLHFTKILSGLDPSLPPAKYTSVRPGLGILPPSQRGQSAAQPAEPQRSKRRERASLGTAGTGDEKERGERKGKGKERERRSDGGSARRVSGRVRDADGDVEMTTTMPERATPRARAQDRSQAVGRSVLSTARVEARRGDLGRVEPEPGPEPDDEVEIEADGGVRIDY